MPQHGRPAAPAVSFIVFAIAVLTSSTGCATLVHGAMQDVAITSEPPAAHVFVNGEHVGVTPATLRVKRRAKHVLLRIEKDGFCDVEIPLKRTVSRWIGGDVAMSLDPFAIQGLNSASEWPPVAASALATTLGIDFLTGAAYSHPSKVRVVLSSGGRTRGTIPTTLRRSCEP